MAGAKRKIDITGICYGRLKVTSEAKQVKHIRYWNCICDCGKESVVAMGSLRGGYTKSCGCLRSEKVSQAQTRNLMGQNFNMLTVVEKTEYKSKSGNIKWKCLCDCGTETIVIGSALVNGTTKSCGCLRFRTTKVMQDILDSNHKIDGVYVAKLTQKLRSDNKTGVKGVTQINGKSEVIYHANIGIKNRNIYLGTFRNFEDAVKARKDAEDVYFKPYLEKHKDKRASSLN